MEISPLEKNNQENIDLLQIEYFSDLPISKNSIIVIEPSNPIAITIRKFLVSLNFENIYICKDVTEGIKIFSDFIGKETSAPIIIDDNLAKQDLKSTIEEILDIQTSAKIIVVTAKEKTDPNITKLFDIGISSVIHKPIDITELKDAISIALEEKNDTEDAPNDDRFEFILSSNNVISENRIGRIINTDQSVVDAWIQKKKANLEIITDKEILEATCNQCGSPNIAFSSKCPSCKQINIKQEVLVEHYSCGEVFPKEKNSDTCPKCNKRIGSVGKDYLESTDYYVCKSCNDRFPRPTLELICLECGNVFVENTIQWKKDVLYKVKK